MLRNLLARIHGDGGHYVAQHGLEKAMEDADQLCAKWRAQQAEAQEPVATINISDDDFGIGLTDDYAFGVKRLPNGKHLLFTRPQPAQRPPLTIAEVEQILARWNYELHGDRSRFIARETELAHGIGFAK